MASPLYEKLWVGSVVNMGSDILAGYDAVVLGDILEHLPDPLAILQELVKFQPSGCLFLISVPNVANIWIRLNLLLGRFDYLDRGILDRTHLRFFTRKTLVSMVQQAGLEIISIRATPIPLELVSSFFSTRPGTWLHAVLASLTSVFPTLLGYQFIIGARKP
jgi:hypothetical protein